MKTPPIDLNTPVENPKLIAAIKKHQQIKSDETAYELFEAFKKSIFLAGMVLNKRLPNNSGEILLEVGERLLIFDVLDNENNRLLALFADHNHLQKFTTEANSTLVLPAKMAMEAAVRDYFGLVINPNSETELRINKDFIVSILHQIEDTDKYKLHSQYEPTESSNLPEYIHKFEENNIRHIVKDDFIFVGVGEFPKKQILKLWIHEEDWNRALVILGVITGYDEKEDSILKAQREENEWEWQASLEKSKQKNKRAWKIFIFSVIILTLTGF